MNECSPPLECDCLLATVSCTQTMLLIYFRNSLTILPLFSSFKKKAGNIVQKINNREKSSKKGDLKKKQRGSLETESTCNCYIVS